MQILASWHMISREPTGRTSVGYICCKKLLEHVRSSVQ